MGLARERERGEREKGAREELDRFRWGGERRKTAIALIVLSVHLCAANGVTTVLLSRGMDQPRKLHVMKLGVGIDHTL